MALIVRKEACPSNNKCPAVMVCPVKALSQKGVNAPAVDEKTCISCGECAVVCPKGALRLEE
jgi:Fe-S-cluster-containing hydrogenase component 2